MKIPLQRVLLITSLFLFSFCGTVSQKEKGEEVEGLEPGRPDKEPSIVVGAERMRKYLPTLRGKRVGVVANQTSRVGKVHLVDTLLAKGIEVKKVFAPEHGFRGRAEAGEKVEGGRDERTGLPIVSLYGTNKKPRKKDLNDLDILVFDIQDVGARFYTYISTLHYVMEAAAENGKKVVVLDRPNPNGFYVDGPVLEEEHSSFVGMHPVPVVHGMTIGEYARMINGEGWLKDGVKSTLEVVKCSEYEHDDRYELPVPPSPNLPNMASVYLYPSLCFFEGTVVSIGRGTEKPFQVLGHPDFKGDFRFTPKSIPGVSSHPKHEGKVCKGYDVSSFGRSYMKGMGKIHLYWLMEMYKALHEKTDFFTPFFDKLAGTEKLREQISEGASEKEIRKSWEPELKAFKKKRKEYLLYPASGK